MGLPLEAQCTVPGSHAGLRVLSIFLEFGLVWRRELVGVLSLFFLSLCWALETCGGPFPHGGRAFGALAGFDCALGAVAGFGGA